MDAATAGGSFAILIENLFTKKQLCISDFEVTTNFHPRTYAKLKLCDLGLLHGTAYEKEKYVDIKTLANREGRQFMEMIHVNDRVPLYTGDYINGQIVRPAKLKKNARSAVFTDLDGFVFGTCDPIKDEQKKKWFSISIIDINAVPAGVKMKRVADGRYDANRTHTESSEESDSSSSSDSEDGTSDSSSDSEESSSESDSASRQNRTKVESGPKHRLNVSSSACGSSSALTRRQTLFMESFRRDPGFRGGDLQSSPLKRNATEDLSNSKGMKKTHSNVNKIDVRNLFGTPGVPRVSTSQAHTSHSHTSSTNVNDDATRDFYDLRSKISSEVHHYGDRKSAQEKKAVIMNFWDEQKVILSDLDHYLSKERDALKQTKKELEKKIASIEAKQRKVSTIKNLIYSETEKLE